MFELVVGLGNVGDKYINNRHNCGFQVIDYFIDYLNLTLDKDSHTGSFFSKFKVNNNKVFFKAKFIYESKWSNYQKIL